MLVTASFLMIHLIPGDPVRGALGPTAPPDLVARTREALGLNEPLWIQYADYLRGLASGDFGTSMITKTPVADVIAQRLPATLALAFLAFLVAVAVAVPLGVTMGVATRRGRRRRTEARLHHRQRGPRDGARHHRGRGARLRVRRQARWLPVAGRSGPDPYILPVLALALGPAVILARIVRVEMVSVLEADFIRTARAKRLPLRVIYLGHALPNALTASLTLAGLLLSSLVAATVLVENVFAWPGLGGTIVRSILDKDYMLVQATVLVYGTFVLFVNLVVDADPRAARPALADQAGLSTMRGHWGRAFRTPVGLTAVTLMGIVLALAVLGPLVWGEQAAAIDTSQMLAGPSPEHWAGTDNLGRDILARVLVATRLSVVLALSATVVAVGVGLLLGSGPMLVGPRFGRLLTGVVNIAVAFPGLLLALFFAVIFGVGAMGAVLAIGLAGAPSFARLCQTLIAGVAQRDFVTAARIAGVDRGRLLARHVLPNIGEPLIVNATIGAGAALLAFAGLSFLGLGVQAPAYDWGRLLMDGLASIYIQPVGALAPGVAIVVAGLAFNLFGETIAKGFGLTTLEAGGPRRPGASASVASAIPAGESGSVSTSAEWVDGGRTALLDVRDLSVSFPTPQGPVRPVRNLTFRVEPGEAVGVVGESGSGKSLTALAVAQLIEEPGRVTATRLRLLGTDLLSGGERLHRHFLGTSLSMVFQDRAPPSTPPAGIGGQLAEVGRHHLGMSRSEARARAVDRLRAVHVPAPERRAGEYPDEFSGGMRQRAMIGMGLMGSPALIIADEPTTALDVTIQRQVLSLLQSIREADGVALLLISHDVAVVRQVCDRVLLMYAGRIVEDLPVASWPPAHGILNTRALVAAVPDMAEATWTGRWWYTGRPVSHRRCRTAAPMPPSPAGRRALPCPGPRLWPMGPDAKWPLACRRADRPRHRRRLRGCGSGEREPGSAPYPAGSV